MSITGVIVFILIVVNVLVSYKGFTDTSFFDRYKFEVDRILVDKDYKRLITSGFLHVSWLHLIFNMLALFFFSGAVGGSLGVLGFVIIYFAGLIGGNLLALLVHRHHGDYDGVGASGAVYGILFASVALYPNMPISLFPLPFSLPSWIYALIFMLFTIYGIRSRKQNVAHDAHLGGALVGMTVALIMQPSAFVENYVIILVIMVPAIGLIYLIITRPDTLLVDNLFYKTHHYTLDEKYNMERADQQQEVDRILEKISRRGMKSLTPKERKMLEDYSKRG